MSDTVAASSFSTLLLRDAPLLDVRAPVEFARGNLTGASNLPLLDDEQRQAIGLRYKQQGQAAAIALGHELVQGQIRERRLRAWQDYLDQNPDAILTCFRGGLRSRIVQQWLAESGYSIPRVEGGYKALRNYLLTTLENAAAELPLILVAGKTGSAKTHLINALDASIDLEGLANHRGSAFGRRVEPQPSQASFENALAIELLKAREESPVQLFLEDESRAIGSLSLPAALFKRMRASSLAVIEASLEARVETILDDYIRSNHADFLKLDPENGESRFRDFLCGSLERINRRLGQQPFEEIDGLMQEALSSQAASGELDGHRAWIERLLRDYYDPMYDFQLGKKLGRIVFRGNREEFLQWARRIEHEKSAAQS